jgi:hypothetical protein
MGNGHNHRRTRILLSAPAVWSAVVLMLAVALLPTVSRLATAMTNGQLIFLQEICTVSSAADGNDAPAPVKAMTACPYCLLQAELPYPVQPSALAAVVLQPLYFLPRLFHLAPSPLFAWINALSRAPPAA